MMFLANTAFFTTYIVCQSSARWITVKHESQANFHHGPLRKYPVLHAVYPWVLGWEIGQHEALRGVPCTSSGNMAYIFRTDSKRYLLT